MKQSQEDWVVEVTYDGTYDEKKLTSDLQGH